MGFKPGIGRMKIRRFKISRENLCESEAILDDPAEFRHLTRVLRLKPGDPVLLFDGQGKEYQATINRVTAREVSFALIPNSISETPSPPSGSFSESGFSNPPNWSG